MAELFKFLKKTNQNLDITFDKKTNTVKVNNSEEDIKELQRQKKVTKDVEKPIKTEPNKPQITPVIRTQYRRIGSGRWS